jgi:hypothetical protein
MVPLGMKMIAGGGNNNIISGSLDFKSDDTFDDSDTKRCGAD